MKFSIGQNQRNKRLSVVVVFHDMRREAERTLYSLGSDYQEGVPGENYEVIAIDNGSKLPLDEAQVREFGSNFRYRYFQTDSASPAAAINFGVDIAEGEYVAVIVDGARMVTPGLVRESLRALEVFTEPFVCALGWHLGPGVQNETMLKGYDQSEEDRLLDSIQWRQSGYRLFEIAALAQSSSNGFLGGMPKECSWFAMTRSVFKGLGGYNEDFQAPGGGLVNHDFLGRVLTRSETSPVVLLGEGSFHQIHGGVATNVPYKAHPWEAFKAEYQQIHNKPFEHVTCDATYYMGTMHSSARRFICPGV
jgi:glycosyltransferase involved in cell wall biosynthesis